MYRTLLLSDKSKQILRDAAMNIKTVEAMYQHVKKKIGDNSFLYPDPI